jgi:hypothetical protein
MLSRFYSTPLRSLRVVSVRHTLALRQYSAETKEAEQKTEAPEPEKPEDKMAEKDKQLAALQV